MWNFTIQWCYTKFQGFKKKYLNTKEPHLQWSIPFFFKLFFKINVWLFSLITYSKNFETKTLNIYQDRNAQHRLFSIYRFEQRPTFNLVIPFLALTEGTEIISSVGWCYMTNFNCLSKWYSLEYPSHSENSTFFPKFEVYLSGSSCKTYILNEAKWEIKRVKC